MLDFEGSQTSYEVIVKADGPLRREQLDHRDHQRHASEREARP